jgi:hypothetical protein
VSISTSIRGNSPQRGRSIGWIRSAGNDAVYGVLTDDLAYVARDQAETSVLFELISARYEQRSLLITANQAFGEWGKIFPDPAMTLAAVDRLVHHATIFEMNVESYRCRTAIDRKQGRPANCATISQMRSACQRQTALCMIVAPRHHSNPVCRASHQDRCATTD